MKKLLALLLALVMLLGLTACNSEDKAGGDPTGTVPGGDGLEKADVQVGYLVKNADGSIWYGHTFEMKDGYITEIRDIEGESEKILKIEYDLENRIATVTCDSMEGPLRLHWNEEGRVAKEIEQRSNGEYTLETVIKTDGLVTEEKILENGVCTIRWVYVYDAGGNLLEETVYDENDEPLSKCTYTYDSEGRTLRSVYESGSGDEYYKDVSEYTYDENGNNTIAKYLDKDGVCYSWGGYTYNAEGKLILETWYDGENNKTEWYEYTYNSAGLPLNSKGYYADGTPVYDMTHEYDEKGNEIRTTEKDAEGEVIGVTECAYQSMTLSPVQENLKSGIYNAALGWVNSGAE